MKIQLNGTFTEKQYFFKKGISKVMLILAIFASLMVLYNATLGFVGDEIPLILYLLTVLCYVYLIIAVVRSHLFTIIDSDGVHIFFHIFPFTKKRFWAWSEIRRCRILQFKPLLELGGWGIRYSDLYGQAFTVSGKIGLQIETLDRKSFLIGTQKADEIKEFLNIE